MVEKVSTKFTDATGTYRYKVRFASNTVALQKVMSTIKCYHCATELLLSVKTDNVMESTATPN